VVHPTEGEELVSMIGAGLVDLGLLEPAPIRWSSSMKRSRRWNPRPTASPTSTSPTPDRPATPYPNEETLMQATRIVTGHDAEGRADFALQAPLEHGAFEHHPGFVANLLWRTGPQPAIPTSRPIRWRRWNPSFRSRAAPSP
jgi:hypothetical protein